MDNLKPNQERREFVRVTHEVPLDFKICNRDTVSKLCAGYAVDISQSGIFCQLGQKVNLNDLLWLSFDRSTLDFCKELENRVFIYQNGIIGNVARVEGSETGSYNVGVRFVTRKENDVGNIFTQTYFLERNFRSQHE